MKKNIHKVSFIKIAKGYLSYHVFPTVLEKVMPPSTARARIIIVVVVRTRGARPDIHSNTKLTYISRRRATRVEITQGGLFNILEPL